MMSASQGVRRLKICLALLILLTIAGCGGLAGEPRIVSTIPPATPAPTEVGYPLTAPDLALGQQIFAQHCTQCHGDLGKGDGALIGNGQNQIPQTPADFTDPATTANKTPLEWFNTITNGQIDNFMPPWNDSLSESERWAVAMYTYTLSYQPEAIAQGKALVAQNGSQTNNLPPQSQLVKMTDTDLLAAFAANADFVNGLDNAQKQDVAAYLRTLTLTNPNVIGSAVLSPASTEEPSTTTTTTAAVSGTVSGQVTNGTAGGTVPPDSKATLHILDDQFKDDSREAPVSADNQFTFSNVPIRTDRNYIVTVIYQGRTFASDFLAGDPAAGKLDLPVTIYEITDDSSVVQIAGWVSQITAVESVLQIAQVVSFSNTSDKAFSAAQLPNDDRYASVQVKLPPGAQILSIAPNDQRYVIGLDGLTVIDTAPVMPGEQHIVQFIYSLPYSGDLQIEQSLGYAAKGPVRLLVTPDTLKVTSEQLVPLGPQTIRDQSYQGYGANATLTATDILRYRLQGAVPADTTVSSNVSVNNLLPVVLVVLGIIAIAAAVIVYLRGRTPQAKPIIDSKVLIDGLIREIAELDDLHAAGKLDEATYQNRRTKLKTRLAELMDSQ